MRLSLLDDRDDLPRSGSFAIGDDGALWQQFGNGSWGRGCLVGGDALVGELLGKRPRFVFLRPAWAHGRPPLTFADYRGCFASSSTESAAA